MGSKFFKETKSYADDGVTVSKSLNSGKGASSTPSRLQCPSLLGTARAPRPAGEGAGELETTQTARPLGLASGEAGPVVRATLPEGSRCCRRPALCLSIVCMWKHSKAFFIKLYVSVGRLTWKVWSEI